ncbi:MAG: hypothetical protein IT180_17620, partial [Acidobacteria bacterium]|nr:hypothetical protein [Acidobacteriota bacterium]
MTAPQAPPRPSWLQIANALVPAVVLVGGVTAAVYLLFARVGQGEDLLRQAGEDLVRHFFLAMGLGTFSTAAFGILWQALGRVDNVGPVTRRLVPLVLSVVAPGALVLASTAVNSSAGLTIGDLLLSAAALAGPIGLAVQGEGQAVRVQVVGGACLLAWLGVAIVFAWPEWSGLLAGPLAIAVVMASGVLWLLWGAFRLQPLFALLVFAGVAVLAAQGSYGQRAIRLTAESETGAYRPDVDAYAASWLHERRAEIALSSRYPVLFITADGGGIRAAYWTTAVLAALMEAEPTFLRQTFVVSGVSGGSVGAAVFGALAGEAGQTPAAGPRFDWRERGQQALSFDLLGAPLARLLTRDPIVSMFCGRARLLCPAAAGDRAIALERTLEGAWRASQGNDRMAMPLLNLWSAPGSVDVPALMLNATEASGNRPRVVSNLSVATLLGGDADVLQHLPEGRTLRLSTAAVLSARFPIISPSALVPTRRGPAGEVSSEALVDGGYFDNSGGASAAPAVQALLRAAEAMRMRPSVVPVAVMITNDTDRTAANTVLQDSLCPPPLAEPTGVGDSLLDIVASPVGTLDAGRANAAESWRRRLVDTVEGAGGLAVEVPLFRCAADGTFRVPLGWSLSRAARTWMDRKVDDL